VGATHRFATGYRPWVSPPVRVGCAALIVAFCSCERIFSFHPARRSRAGNMVQKSGTQWHRCARLKCETSEGRI
jgi:hypothetical protein